MDSVDSVLAKENSRMKNYNYLVKDALGEEEQNVNMEELSYTTLNSRYAGIQEGKNKDTFAENKAKRKSEIEKIWHTKTSEEAKQLTEKKGNRTDPDYYSNYSLEQFEVLLKNNDRGGNSDLYNDVVTDLELYNKVKKSGSREELITLSLRLEESCNNYLTKRKPHFTSGKIRKAIIAKLKETLYTSKETMTTDKLKDKVQGDMQQFNGTSSTDSKDIKITNLNNAMVSNFDLISQYLQGTIQLTDAEIEQLDGNMDQIWEEMKKDIYEVDANQNKDLSTRFFNALGWTSRVPNVVPDIDDEIIARGPVDRKLLHTIAAFTTKVNDEEVRITGEHMAKQLMGYLAGNSRHFMSNGYAGKGTYLATAKNKNEMGRAREDSWTKYGTTNESVQLTLAFNEKTRLASQDKLEKLKGTLVRKLPRLAKHFNEITNGMRGGDPSLSIVGALFGYNATICRENSSFSFDYYVTYDRSTLSIATTAEKRVCGDDFGEIALDKEEQKYE